MKVAQLQMAARLPIPFKMHVRYKTLDDAGQIFIKEYGSPEPEARREAYRGATDPGYINYTLGKLVIIKLREDYRAKMGADFISPTFRFRPSKNNLP